MHVGGEGEGGVGGGREGGRERHTSVYERKE